MELIQTPLGLLEVKYAIGPDRPLITSVLFVQEGEPTDPSMPLAIRIHKYFSGETTKFNVTNLIKGTPFQKKVWRAIHSIPYGQTRTYAQIAQLIGHPKAYRAVANACGRNHHTLFIPCHRVVATNGIGGYEWGLECKRWLLKHEREHTKHTRTIRPKTR